jgi:hypothetical protein
MKNKFFYALVISIHGAALHADKVTVMNLACAGYCTGAVSQKSGNAVGDKRNIDTKDITFQNLGEITDPQAISLKLPEDQRFGYKVVFASGEVSTPMRFIGNYESQDGQYMYKFHRQLSGESLWTEVGEIYAAEKLATLTFTLNPDGTLVFTGRNGQLATMYLATKNLGKPKK